MQAANSVSGTSRLYVTISCLIQSITFPASTDPASCDPVHACHTLKLLLLTTCLDHLYRDHAQDQAYCTYWACFLKPASQHIDPAFNWTCAPTTEAALLSECLITTEMTLYRMCQPICPSFRGFMLKLQHFHSRALTLPSRNLHLTKYACYHSPMI